MGLFSEISSAAAFAQPKAEMDAAESAWERTKSEGALEDAVSALLAVVNDRRFRTRLLMPEVVAAAVRCARLLTIRAERHGFNIADIDAAVALLVHAQPLAVARVRPGIDVDLGMVHQARYRATHDSADLDRAAKHYRLTLSADAHPRDTCAALLALAQVLFMRHFHRPDLADLGEVAAAARQVESHPQARPDEQVLAGSLVADSMVERFRFANAGAERADAAILDEAIVRYTALRTALGAADPRGRRLSENQALAYELRFEARGRPDDLDHCIELLEGAVGEP